MPKSIDLNDLQRLVSDEPKQRAKSKREAFAIARSGAWNAELELRMQENRSHKVSSFERKVFAEVDFAKQSQGSGKRNRSTLKRDPRTIAHSTVCVSYKLRDRSLYFYGHTIATMGDFFRRGIITRGEWNEFVHNVELMG